MEIIDKQLDKIEEQLDKIDAFIDNAKSSPFSPHSVSIKRNDMFLMLDEIKDAVNDLKRIIPKEISMARKILADKEEHLSEAKTKAERLIKATESEVARMKDEHEIMYAAKEEAEKIEVAALEYSEIMREGARQYVDEKLEQLAKNIYNILKKQMENSQNLEDIYEKMLTEVEENRHSLNEGE